MQLEDIVVGLARRLRRRRIGRDDERAAGSDDESNENQHRTGDDRASRDGTEPDGKERAARDAPDR